MRISLNKSEQIERYLSGAMHKEESTMFTMKMVESPLLQQQVNLHRKVRDVIRLYRHTLMRANLNRLHTETFRDPARVERYQRILQWFNPK